MRLRPGVRGMWFVAVDSQPSFERKVMSPKEPIKDPQDKEFGATASRDQEIVDELERNGVTEDELPDEPAHHPRSAGKAEVQGGGS